jgi:hypothetical protein
MTYTDGKRLAADSYRELVEPLEKGSSRKGSLVAVFTHGGLKSRNLTAMATWFAETQSMDDTMSATFWLTGQSPELQATYMRYQKRKRVLMKAEFRRRWEALMASSKRISVTEMDGLLQSWGKPWPDRGYREKEGRKTVRLSPEKWRHAIREAAGGRCQADGCRAAGTEAHHLTPIEFGGDPFGPGVWLCAKHHNQVHRATDGRPAKEMGSTHLLLVRDQVRVKDGERQDD